MNTPPPVAPHSLRGFAWLALPLAFFVMVGALAVGVTGYFRLSRDATCLRNSLTPGTAGRPVGLKKKVELHVGPFTCFALRAGLAFFPLDPNTQTALQAVRGAEVGVYHLEEDLNTADRSALLGEADRAMKPRGWDRIVGVVKPHELVAIYVPQGQSGSANLRTCLAVLNKRDLVVVSAQSYLEPLMELAKLAEGGAFASDRRLRSARPGCLEHLFARQ
jgi:hypothetical protein